MYFFFGIISMLDLFLLAWILDVRTPIHLNTCLSFNITIYRKLNIGEVKKCSLANDLVVIMVDPFLD